MVNADKFIQDIARKAGRVLQSRFGKTHTVRMKANVTDVVTEADMAANRLMVSAIRKKFPSHGIISEETGNHQERGAQPVHVIIEFNRDVANRAREWAMRQTVPVVVLEGDWKEEIRKLPEGILTGALADPYPLNAKEKHKDAVMAAREVHDRLRPGGVLTYYADSQYALSEDHAKIAQEAGFKYIGVITSRFARPGTNFGEYYRSPRMAIPRLYKEGGTGSAKRETITLTQQQKQDLLRKIFVEDPKSFRETYFGPEVERLAA